MLGRSSGLTVAQVRRAFRLLVFSLLPALVLFGTLEIVQRVRYSIRYDSVRWMYYGFWTGIRHVKFWTQRTTNVYCK